MKLLVFIFIIYFNYSLSQTIQVNSKKIIYKSPKKFKPGFHQINGKYVKPITEKSTVTEKKAYTVFENIFSQLDKRAGRQVPESSYFHADTPVSGQKTRVKKVLTDFTGKSLRRKRSTDEKDQGKEILKSQPTLDSKNDGAVKKLKSESKKRKVSISAKKKREFGHSGHQKKNTNLSRHKRLSHSDNKRLKSHSQSVRNKNLKRNRNRGKKPSSTGSKKSRHRGQKKSKIASKRRPRNGSKHKALQSRKVDGRRLIAGRDALIEDYPYVVSIQKNYNTHWCAGALLNPRLVITTANCLWRSERISKMRVRAGSRYPDRGGQVAKIQEVMKHPGWNLRRNPDNDVALVLLDRNIKFSNTVHGVDLPNRVMWPAFDDAWITSWGSERRDGVYENKGMSLQVYHARLMEREECNNVTQRFGVIVSENFICLAQTGRRAPCTRDTGAPAVSDGVVWGLASWGIRKLCGTERFPAMFSYLASQSNMNFITNATHRLMADERYYPFGDKFPRAKAVISTTGPVTLPF